MMAACLQPGDLVFHSGQFHEVADIEVAAPIVKVATMAGGRLGFTTCTRVTVKRNHAQGGQQ